MSERAVFTFRDLENVIALADFESVTLAAAEVGLSQPAMSSAIKKLELVLATTLVIRHRGKGVSLTPEGLAFAAEGRTILGRATHLQSEMSGLSSRGTGRLFVGSLTTVAPIVAPSLIRTFVERHPRIPVELVTGSQDQLLDFLTEGTVHLALTYDLGLKDNLRFEHLNDALPHVVLNAKHPLASRASLGLKDLAAEPYILLDLPISRDYFTSLFFAAGLQPRPTARHTDLALVRSMVGNGFGYSLVNLVPAGTEALDGSHLAYIPLASDVVPLRLGIATRPDDRQLRSVTDFLDHARTYVSSNLVIQRPANPFSS